MNSKEFMKKAGKIKWKTKTGEVLEIRQMDLGHLENCRKLLLRRKDLFLDEAGAAAAYSGSEMAMYYAERAMDEAFDKAGKSEKLAEILRVYIEAREEHNFILEGP